MRKCETSKHRPLVLKLNTRRELNYICTEACQAMRLWTLRRFLMRLMEIAAAQCWVLVVYIVLLHGLSEVSCCLVFRGISAPPK